MSYQAASLSPCSAWQFRAMWGARTNHVGTAQVGMGGRLMVALRYANALTIRESGRNPNMAAQAGSVSQAPTMSRLFNPPQDRRCIAEARE